MPQREIAVSNIVSTIFGTLTTVLLILFIGLFGVSVNTPIIVGVSLFFFSIPLLNKAGYTNLSRVLLSCVPPVLVVVGATLGRIHDPEASDMSYYDSRLYLILCAIIPCLVFKHVEKLRLYGSLSVIGLCLVLFDPIHELFRVGYYQEGFTGKSYYYINYAALITMVGIVAGAIGLRRVIQKAEAESAHAMAQLKEAYMNLEMQNEEIQAQREELLTNQELLRSANKIIEERNNSLQQEVTQVNDELEVANRELLRQNTELLQFSYTISHNLRGPIARLLGLTNLADLSTRENTPDVNIMPVVKYIKKSAEDLDGVFHDLTRVLDTRNAAHQQRHDIDLNELWHSLIGLIDAPDGVKAGIHADFSCCKSMRSFRPFVHSILFNLVNNAVRFRSPNRPLTVAVTSSEENGFVVLTVSDNGIGIDLDAYKDEIFKMYKRFHLHEEGKGLGLYLVKSQIELLGGYVTVASAPDQGSTFKVFFRNENR